ncbi:MAG TPA: hemolysin III family protein [Gemmatimonadales bacterium]
MALPEREPVNGWIHLGGALLAAAGLVVLLAQAQRQGSLRHLTAAVVFGGSAIMMFGASALYHLRPRSLRAPLYRRLDHAAIYLFIAGTYTPLCLVVLWPMPVGRLLLVVVWTLAALGVFQAVRAVRPRRGAATALYLGLGWVGVLTAPLIASAVPWALAAWLLVGGVLYTIGACLYWRKWPRGRPGLLGFHECWHVCVLVASASHFWAIHTYVLPLP